MCQAFRNSGDLDVQFLVSRSKEWIDLPSEDLGILNSQYYLKLYIKGYSFTIKKKKLALDLKLSSVVNLPKWQYK